MKKPNQDDEPFFITEEIAAEMIADQERERCRRKPCSTS